VQCECGGVSGRMHVEHAPVVVPRPARTARRTAAVSPDCTPAHSTVTVFARLRGWSTSAPRSTATWYA
jgi:hypothetical protein